jgi:predicted amidohydrolase YtcJ
MSTSNQLIVRNAIVHTMDGNVAQAIALEGGRVTAVGDEETITGLTRRGARVLDAGGRVVIPGITDSHTHFKRSTIVAAFFIDFRELKPKTISEVLESVRSKARHLPPNAWIQGDGLNDLALAERRFPIRQELDAVSGGRPVVLRSIGRHVVAANTRALELAGIDRDTVPPSGGRIDVDADGDPTGVLHEQAKLRLDMTRSDTVIPRFGASDRVEALRRGMRTLHANGIVGIHEMAREPDEIGDYLRLREEGGLTARITMYIRGVEASTRLEYITGLGLRGGLGDDWFRLAGAKFSIDGSVLPRNAAVYDGYPGEPDNLGLLRIEQEELDWAVETAHASGLQIAVHAIGQRAVDMALDSFARLDATERERLRHRIEHGYLPERPGQLRRMRELGIVWSTQPADIEELGDDWIGLFGEEALEGVVPLRTALDLGLPVQINSDFPVTSLDPFVGIRSAVTRRTATGRVLDSSQAVSVHEAFRMMTTTPAFTAHQEHKAGTLEVGKLADVVILAEDPFRDPEALTNLTVHTTIVGGRVRYSTEFDEDTEPGE